MKRKGVAWGALTGTGAAILGSGLHDEAFTLPDGLGLVVGILGMRRVVQA